MSLTPTLTASPPVDRLTAPTDGLSLETREAGCRSYPGQFAKPNRNRDLPQTPRRTARSLSAILNRIGGAGTRTDRPATGNAQAARPTTPETGRTNILNSPLPCDELDPLPFVDDAVRWRYERTSEKIPGNKTLEGNVASGSPVCLVTPCRGNLSNTHLPKGSAPGGPETAIECRLLDVSMSGIAIHCAHVFERGSALLLQIRTTDSGPTIETRGTVVRCDPSKGEGYQVVCRLERYFQFTEIHAIGHDLFASAIV